MILVELTAATDAAGTTQTFYVSDERFVTEPDDTPANTAFRPSLIDPGSIGVHAFSDGRTGGATKLETGELVLANGDGHYDAWKDYGFDGREIVIRSGEAGAAYPGGFQVLFRGAMEAVEVDSAKAVVRLRDKQFVLSRLVQETRYAGTNSGSTGLEGTADDLKGKVKPKCFGKVFNIAPPCVNTNTRVYEVHDGGAVASITVYQGGLAMTPNATPDYANSAALLAAAITAGTFATCLAEGLFRLGSDPSGEITADVTQGATAADRTAAQVLKALAIAAGVDAGDINASDVTALDSDNSAEVGIWIGEEVSAQDAMDQIARSVGAAYNFDGPGELRMWRLEAPSGSAALSLAEYQIGDLERRPPRDNTVPVWSVTVKHSRLYRTQTADLAGAVTAARRAYLAEEHRRHTSEDAGVKDQFLLAGAMEVETLLTSASDAETETDRLLALHSVPRDIFDFWVPLSAIPDGLKLGDVVEITHSRFGLSGGESFRLIGYRPELARKIAYLTVWG